MRGGWKKRIVMAVLAAICLISTGSLAAASEENSLFTEEEQEYIERAGTLKVGYVSDRQPISFRNPQSGELDGVSRRIFDRIQQISGLQFAYVELPKGDIVYDYLQSEKFDLVTSVEYNEENKKARGILISRPYLSSRKVIVGRSDLEFDQSKKLQVAVATGSQTLKKVLSEQYPSFEIVDFQTIEDCFEAVSDGVVDLLIQNQYVVEYRLGRAKYASLKAIPVEGLSDQLCFSAVVPLEDTQSQEWLDKSTLVSIIDKCIDQLSVDEVTNYVITETMEHQYSYTFSDFLYKYRYSIIALLIGVILLSVLIFISFGFYVRSVKARSEAKAKGQFLSTMSHEIRTPLNGLIGLNNLMERNLGDQDKMRVYVKQSSYTAQYLLSLVNDILDMSKLQDQKMEIHYMPFSLPATLDCVSVIEENRMAEKKLKFSMDLEISYPFLTGDESHVEQVLLNLIDNAYKFTPGGGTITLKVRQEKKEEETVVTTIEVADTGCGMSEAFQKKIFDSFTQERSTVSKGNQGTGLGMSISSGLARLMGGSLEVSSELGKGSKFTFVFPAQIAARTPEKEEAAVKSAAVSDAGRTRLLVAEDNELNGQILVELLRESGFQADLVTDGQQALDAFAASEEGYYDFILMDMLMPVKDGMETTREIRAMNRADARTIKIFACTANAFKEDEDKAYACGMNGFVAKPVDINKLLRMLKE